MSQPEVQRIIGQVEEIAQPLVQMEGMEVWGVELRPEGGRWILRLLVDKPGGVTLDDLTRINRQLGDLLDVHDLIPWRYTLEVSSPGITRPLMRPDHYTRYLGKRVKVRTVRALGGRRVFSGLLLEANTEGIAIADKGGKVHIPFSLILKGTYEHDFSFNQPRLPRSSLGGQGSGS